MVTLILVITALNKEFIRSWLCSKAPNLRIDNLWKNNLHNHKNYNVTDISTWGVFSDVLVLFLFTLDSTGGYVIYDS